MSFLTDALFGTSAKAKDSTNSDINPAQASSLAALLARLQGGTPGQTGTVTPTNEIGAPVPAATTTSLAGLENIASGVSTKPTTAQTGTINNATGTFNALLDRGPPIVSPADSAAAFKTGVVDPLTSDFLQYTIPAIAGKYGASAGGAYSSDALAAREAAGQTLGRTLSQAGSTYALDTQNANQQATTSYDNTLSSLLGLSGAITNLPTTEASATSTLLNQILTGGTVAQAGQQSTDTAQTDQVNTQNKLTQNLLSLLLGGSTAPTQSTNTVVTPGTQGLLTSALSSFSGSAGGSSALASLLGLV